ncbi:MAG TPA: redox-sensing transcriptional repressor Rex [Phycisphaerae bacterium]|nr:redox-sensing transcriptional repressor Rex [Phycisphaerae bacterium]HPS53385.1 redox-sensing transcriptional repressor Rex [Phycisphaerae bacterium]
MTTISSKTIERFSIYRRLLERYAGERVASGVLAELAGVTAAQVRRDMMALGCMGSSSRGYIAAELRQAIGEYLDAPEGLNIALVGAGELGRSILSYFAGRHKKLRIVAAFDVDPWLTDRKLRGCECYQADKMPEIIAKKNIKLAIIAVPPAAAQQAADVLIKAGVTGILNFSPTALTVPENIFVEYNDITTSLEKVAFFARHIS